MSTDWTQTYGRHELAVITRMRDAAPTHPGWTSFPRIFDQFELSSDQGLHAAFVMEALGPSLSHLVFQCHLAPLGTSAPKVICKTWYRQLLHGLDYLHTIVGVIHSGE